MAHALGKTVNLAKNARIVGYTPTGAPILEGIDATFELEDDEPLPSTLDEVEAFLEREGAVVVSGGPDGPGQIHRCIVGLRQLAKDDPKWAKKRCVCLHDDDPPAKPSKKGGR